MLCFHSAEVARNSKHIRMTEIMNPQPIRLLHVSNLEFACFEFVLNFP